MSDPVEIGHSTNLWEGRSKREPWASMVPEWRQRTPVAFRRWNAEWSGFDYATPEDGEDFTGWEPLYGA